MKLKISQSFLAIIVLIESAPLSSADKMMLNVITDSAQHKTLSQAVIEIIGSLDGDKPSATNVIKVTSDVDAGTIDLFTETIKRNINGPSEIHIQNNDNLNIKHFTCRHNAVLIVNQMTLREIENFLWPLNCESSRKFLIIFLEKETISPLESSIKLMLDIMWRKFILNVHVVTLKGNGDVHLYTFFPYTKDFCGQVHPVVWNIYRNDSFIMKREHYPRKTDNFHQCKLNVAVFDVPPYMIIRNTTNGVIDVEGADGELLKTLSNELNFSINFTVVSEDVRWGEIYANRSATGALGLVSIGEEVEKFVN